MTDVGHQAMRKFVAPELVIGTGARHLVPRYAENFGARKVLIVTDAGLVAANWASQVAADLAEANLPYSLFAGVTPNPRVEEVEAGAEMYRRERCNIIVSVGGGSPTDCAKGIGIAASNPCGNILDYAGADNVPQPMAPLICVPSTCSGADVSQFALITDLRRRWKVEVVSKAIVPDVSLLDPELLTTMPADLSAYTGIDALAHAIESYASNGCSRLTDLLSLDAIRLLAGTLVPSRRNPTNVEERAVVQRASLQAGLAFSNAGLGLAHAMSHGVGGLTDLPHGQCIAPLIRPVIAFNFSAAPARYRSIGSCLGLALEELNDDDALDALLSALGRFLGSVDLDITLGALGLTHRDIPDLMERTFLDACVVTNPRAASRRDIELLYEKAL